MVTAIVLLKVRSDLINEVAEQIIEFKGKLIFNKSKPDGTPRKLLDVSKINELGWKAKIFLKDGIKKTFEWYKRQSNIISN